MCRNNREEKGTEVEGGNPFSLGDKFLVNFSENSRNVSNRGSVGGG